ncbi:MAG: hypothetical protein J7J27_01280 [Euryarchaeota archaeon]|nr:hypothetical protein [Euryarchaeota archaeon]
MTKSQYLRRLMLETMKRKERLEILIVLALYIVAYMSLLVPYTRYYVWGSDTGEYYWILKYFSEKHAMPHEFFGWALVYHFMYGFFATLSPLVQVGLNPLVVLKYATPTVVALSSVCMYLLARTLTRDIIYSALATLVYSLALPRIFAVSHPMPGAMGDLFLIVLYYLVILSYKRNKVLPLTLFMCSLPYALVHHLSHFVFIASMAVLAFVHRLYGKDDMARTDVIVFSVAYFSFVLYWINVPNFEQIIIDAIGMGKREVIAVSIIAYAAYLLIFMTFPFRTLREPLRIPPRKEDILKMLLIYVIVAALTILVAINISVPGTNIKISWKSIVYVLPILAIGFLAYPGWLVMKSKRLHLEIFSWLFAIFVIMLYGILTKSTVFIPYRYAQYIWTPVSIFIGIGIAYVIESLASLLEKFKLSFASLKTVIYTLLGLVIVLSLIITAYPSQDAIAGFEEGSSFDTFKGVLWIAVNIPSNAIVAADHRISDLIFGFANINATWDDGAEILLSEDVNETLKMMKFFKTPSGYKRIDYVAFDKNTIKGVAGVQWETARPMSERALKKFQSQYFEKVYDNGYFVVYKVLWEKISNKGGG